MDQFEKVCNGLEHCAEGINPCSSCVYDKECKAAGTSNAAIADALTLIRKQQERIKELEEAQRVMVYQDCVKDMALLITEEDFKKADAWGIIPAWIEYRPELESAEDGWELIDCNVFHNVFKRAWTQRPTDEQRKAVQWDAAE